MPPTSKSKPTARVKALKASPQTTKTLATPSRAVKALHTAGASSSPGGARSDICVVDTEETCEEEGDIEDVVRLSARTSGAHISSARTTTTTTTAITRASSTATVVEDTNAAAPAGLCAASLSTSITTTGTPSMAPLSRVCDGRIALEAYAVDSDEDDDDERRTSLERRTAVDAWCVSRETLEFDEEALVASRTRLLEQLTRTHTLSSSATLLTKLVVCGANAQEYFCDGFQLTVDDATQATGPHMDDVLACEYQSLRSASNEEPKQSTRSVHACSRSRSGSSSAKEVRLPARGRATYSKAAGECLLEPAATSLYRSRQDRSSRGPHAASPPSPDANTITPAPQSLRAFLHEQIQLCHACEDALVVAHRDAEVTAECRASAVAQQLYRSQHPPRPKDALCLRTGKRRREDAPVDEEGGVAENALTSNMGADSLRAPLHTSFPSALTRIGGGVGVRAPAEPTTVNAFDVMAAEARSLAARRDPLAQSKESHDTCTSRMAARSLAQHMQTFYRDEWKQRQAAHAEEDAKRHVRRLHELPLLVDDAMHYAHQLLVFQEAAASVSVVGTGAPTAPITRTSHESRDTAATATTPTMSTIGPVVYGDGAVPLYGRYPPPLLRTTSFASETIRLLKWLRTWRRQGQGAGEALSSGTGSGGSSHPQGRVDPCTRGRDSDRSAVRTTAHRRGQLEAENVTLAKAAVGEFPHTENEEDGESTRPSPALAVDDALPKDVPLPDPSETVAQEKKTLFLRFFGAAAKVVKDEPATVRKKETAEAAPTAAPETRLARSQAPVSVVNDTSTSAAPSATVAAAQDLYKRRWHHAVRHSSSFFFAAPAVTTASLSSPSSTANGSASVLVAAPRSVRGLPFFDEMVEEQQDGALLGSTREAYCDVYGNRLRSARLAQKEVEKRVAEEAARRKLEKKKGYFAREADGHHTSDATHTGALDVLLYSRRLQEQKRRRQEQRRRRHRRRHRYGVVRDGSASSFSSRSPSSSSSSSSSGRLPSRSLEDTDDDEAKSEHSVATSVCTVSSVSSAETVSSASQSSESTSSSVRSVDPSAQKHKQPHRRRRRERRSSTASASKRSTRPVRRVAAAVKAKLAAETTNNERDDRGGEEEITNIAVVSGPCGSGKTASVYLAAQLLGYRVVEMNASVKRSPKNVEHLLAELTRSYRLSGLQQGRSSVTVEEELMKLKREHELAVERLKAEAEAAAEEAERKRKEARRANTISADAVAAFFKTKPKDVASKAAATDVVDVVEVESVSPAKSVQAVEETVVDEVPTRDLATGTASGRLTASSSSQSTTCPSTSAGAAGTLLLFEDADILLEDESAKPFYAAVRDLAYKSKVPIVVTVSTPALAPSSAASTSGTTSGAPRRAAGTPLPLFNPRYPMDVSAFSRSPSAREWSREDAHGETAMGAMEEADLRFTDELSSPHFMRSTYTHVPFSSSAAAGFFGQQTPFTQLALPPRTALFVQLLLVAAVELHALELVPEPPQPPQPSQTPAPASASADGAARVGLGRTADQRPHSHRRGTPPTVHGGLTALCEKLLGNPQPVPSPDESAPVATSTATAPPAARLGAQLRSDRVESLCALADRLRRALFGTHTPDPSETAGAEPSAVALDDAVMAEASTTDVRFWLNHLQMLLLTPTGEDVVVPGASASCLAVSPTSTADCDSASEWDQQRGRLHDCLAANDAACPRQRCWELSACLNYDTDITHELATVHHPTRQVDYDVPGVFELAAMEQTTQSTQRKRARTSSSASSTASPLDPPKSGAQTPTSTASVSSKVKSGPQRAVKTTMARARDPKGVHDNENDKEEDDDDDVVVAPQKVEKRGRGRPPSRVSGAAAVATTPSTASASSSLPTAAKPSVWSLFSTPKTASCGSGQGHTSSPLSPPAAMARRTEGTAYGGETEGKPVSPLDARGGDQNISSSLSLPPAMFADCAAFFAPLPVSVVLPYGPTQRRLFPSRPSLITNLPTLAEDRVSRSHQRRWQPLLTDRPRSASVLGLTPGGGVVAAESELAQVVSSPYVRVRGTQETSAAHRITRFKRWWGRPRKADAAKRLVAGYGLDALEDYLGFATTLLAPPRN